MPRTIRLQSDSNAHDRPWRVAVEQGYLKDEGLDVEYHEDNPKGVAGRVENFSERWKESQLQKGALEVYPVCEWGAIERVQVPADLVGAVMFLSSPASDFMTGQTINVDGGKSMH